MEQLDEQRLECIPIECRGICWQCDCGIEGLASEWKILLPLTNEGYYWFTSVEQDLASWYEFEFGISVKKIKPPEMVNEKLFKKRCLIAGTPFKFLPLVLRVLNKTTGNVWLDEPCINFYGWDYNSKYPWTESSIRFLTREWHRTQRLIRYCDKFMDWLRQDLHVHFSAVLELWNQDYPIKN